MNVLTAVSVTKALHDQTLRHLLSAETNARLAAETSELASRLIDVNRDLETANQELALANKSLESVVATDSLTGVANRYQFDLNITREWRRAARERTPVSLLMLDVNYVKKFNDTYGHPERDDCLRDVAAVGRSARGRPGDTLARYGGEEFAATLPNTSPEAAAHVARKILTGLAGRDLPHRASPLGRVSVSSGAACMIPGPDDAPADLIRRADAALYRAKQGGRDRLRVAESPQAAISAAD